MPQLTIEQALQMAQQHHQAGQLAQAEALYRQILQQDPNHSDALHLLGMVAYQMGRNESAVDLIGRSIALQPHPEACRNLGVALAAQGQLDAAIAAYRQAIALNPNYAEAYGNLGNALQAKGQLDAAIAMFRQAIALIPRPEACCQLGNALRSSGQPHEASAAYRQAIALNPQYPEAHNNLGVTLMELGQPDAAIAAFRQAIALKPRYAEAHFNLGTALRDAGQPDAAIAALRQAIALKPNHPGAFNNYGNALQARGLLEEAVAAYRQAIALDLNYAEAYGNLGAALQDQGELDAAIAACRQAIALKPGFPEAHNNLGSALHSQGQLDAAVAACRQAIALKPGFPQAYNTLGTALHSQGQLDAATAAFRRAIALKPDFSEAHSNLGNALQFKGQIDEAVAACQQAIDLNPIQPGAYANLGNALLSQGQLDEAIATYRQVVALAPDHAGFHSNLLYTLYYHPAYDGQAMAQEARRWAQRHAEPLKRFIQPHANDRNPERRLRIGYVSADFRDHASAFFLVPLLAAHDHQACEISCYAHVARPDHLTARMRALSDHWRNTVGVADEALAEMIRRDQIDILVDLKLHTANNRLPVFARKPAPVQATWLGYPGSTGLDTIDYRLSDPYLDPPGMDESIYTEQTLRLPESFWCYDPLDGREISCNALPALANGYVTFGCLNNFSKVNEAVLRLWAKVLRAVPSSRLLLLTPEGAARSQVLKLLERETIDPQRLEFVTIQPRPQYLQSYHRMDLGLDTFPCNGHTTSLDSFWMGVPVVTLVGQTAMGRAGSSILANLGLPELAARSEEAYVGIAGTLAADLPHLGRLRATLRQRMEQSPLMDAPRFARNVEAAYRQMWRHWCLGVPAGRTTPQPQAGGPGHTLQSRNQA